MLTRSRHVGSVAAMLNGMPDPSSGNTTGFRDVFRGDGPKPTPLIVNCMPPSVGPIEGEMDVMFGPVYTNVGAVPPPSDIGTKGLPAIERAILCEPTPGGTENDKEVCERDTISPEGSSPSPKKFSKPSHVGVVDDAWGRYTHGKKTQ